MVPWSLNKIDNRQGQSVLLDLLAASERGVLPFASSHSTTATMWRPRVVLPMTSSPTLFLSSRRDTWLVHVDRVHTPLRLWNGRLFTVFQGYFTEEFKAIFNDKKHKNYTTAPRRYLGDTTFTHAIFTHFYVIFYAFSHIVDAVIIQTNINVLKEDKLTLTNSRLFKAIRPI